MSEATKNNPAAGPGSGSGKDLPVLRTIWQRLRSRARVSRTVVAACSLLGLTVGTPAAPLMEEGFPYPVGTSLAGNSPWAGSSGSSVSVVSGNLTLTNLRSTVPAGGMVQITGGTNLTVYRNFSSTAVTGGSVYFSALLRCTQLPTNSQFIASLMDSGNTSPSRDTDPLDLYVGAVTNGYRLSVITAGSDPASARQTLTANSTHFIVLRYDFGSSGQASIYLDPTPGGVEPSSPNGSTSGDNGTGASTLQILLFRSSSSVGQGIFDFDTLRIGTNWADVTPKPVPLSLSGPDDQAVCYGSGAGFSVLASGTPPFTYQWRTNGVAVPGATTNLLALYHPVVADAQNQFDVVVNDAFGSITSRVARLYFTTNAAAIITPPASQLVLPGVSNVIFSATVTGDEPLSFQWRTNGIAIPGATNLSYTLANPGPADVTNALDFVVSNPCGSATSAPPVGVYFPNTFNLGYDAGAGFFGGENIIFTNASGLSFYVWSTPDLSVPVPQWTLEGPMSELPLGTTGKSRYGINLNPQTSPVYYIIAQTNTGPYTPTEALIWLTTQDFASFTVNSSNVVIDATGLFAPNSFYTAYDAGAGFFGGENLILTNASSLNFYVWSSPDLSVSVTNWTFEGPMSELPLGTTGQSRYGINLNPQASPVYYIFAQTNTGNFTPLEPLSWLTTPDFASFTVISSVDPISAGGFFTLPAPPSITQPPLSQTVLAGQNASLFVTAAGSGLGYQWLLNNNGISGASAPVLGLTNVSTAGAGAYVVVVTNLLGAVTSSVATLSIALPPALNLTAAGAGIIQLQANSITGLTYIVQSATNLISPAWIAIQTNSTGATGTVSFQTNAANTGSQFYRLVFP